MTTPLVQSLGGLLTLLFDFGDSPQLELIQDLIGRQQGIGVPIVVSMVVFGAAISEELVFRGFVQTRLAERWPRSMAVLLPAIVFAVMHMDPTHAAAVFPLGLMGDAESLVQLTIGYFAMLFAATVFAALGIFLLLVHRARQPDVA